MLQIYKISKASSGGGRLCLDPPEGKILWRQNNSFTPLSHSLPLTTCQSHKSQVLLPSCSFLGTIFMVAVGQAALLPWCQPTQLLGESAGCAEPEQGAAACSPAEPCLQDSLPAWAPCSSSWPCPTRLCTARLSPVSSGTGTGAPSEQSAVLALCSRHSSLSLPKDQEGWSTTHNASLKSLYRLCSAHARATGTKPLVPTQAAPLSRSSSQLLFSKSPSFKSATQQYQMPQKHSGVRLQHPFGREHDSKGVCKGETLGMVRACVLELR